MFPRDLPEAFAQARTTLEPKLELLGFRSASEAYYPEAFGSAHAEYSRRGRRVRLVWDGKDRWLWFQITVPGVLHPSTKDWTDLEQSIGAVPIQGFVVDGARVTERINDLAQ